LTLVAGTGIRLEFWTRHGLAMVDIAGRKRHEGAVTQVGKGSDADS